MEKSVVLNKTARGLEEIKTRSHSLSQRLRTLLIVIDGKLTLGDLLARFPAFPDVEQSVASLLKDGFVQALEAKAVEPAVDEGARARAVSELCRALYDVMGPDADALTARLEAARERAEFLAALEDAVISMEALAGKQKTQRFADQARVVTGRFWAG